MMNQAGLNQMIGCSDASLYGKMSLYDRLRLLREAGFESLDFGLYRYSLTPDSPMKSEHWKEWVQQAREIIRESGLIVGQMHCVWDAKLAQDLSWPKPTAIYYRSIEACAMLGCRRLIFHPLEHAFRMSCEDERETIIQANAEWFGLLAGCANQNGVEIHLENTFDFGNFQNKGDPVFPCASGADIVEVVNRVDHPVMKFCLDTGHANIAGQDICEMIKVYGDRLASLHLNDNYGQIYPIYSDLHLFPGWGRIDWGGVFAALREVRYSGILNLEPVAELGKSSPEVCRIQLKAAADTLKEMAFGA